MAWWNFRKRESHVIPLNEQTQNYAGGTGINLFQKLDRNKGMNLSGVFSAVELISNSLAQLPIYVKTKKDNKVTIVENHQIYEAINKSLLTRFNLIKNLVTDMLLYGNGFAYIKRDGSGNPKELVYCPHGQVNIIYNKSDLLNKDLYYIIPSVKSGRIEPINMIHVVKNSKDGVNGIGVLQYANDVLRLAGYTEQAADKYFSSGLNVTGVLKTTDPRIKLDEKQRQDILNGWKQANGVNGNGISIVTGGLDYSPVSNNSKDAQLLETRLFNLQEIARFFSINPVLLGDLSHSSYSTIEASLLEFVTHTLSAYITLFQEEFSRKLLKPSESLLYVDFDENHILKSDKQSQANYISTLVKSGVISINEGRELLGLNKMDGANDLIIPYSDISQNKVNNKTDNDTDTNSLDNDNLPSDN